MLSLAFAAQVISLPIPANAHAPDIRALFTADDFPAYLQGVNLKRTVYTRTTVRPDGSIQGCVVEASSGDARLDAYTCALIVKRAKLLPASWVDGSSVYGVIRAPVRWTISDAPPTEEERLKEEIPDLQISVDHLPRGAHSIVNVYLEIGADENGRPITCAGWPPQKGDHRRHFPELIPIACQQTMARYTALPPVDESAKHVRSVQTVSIHFKIDR